MDPTPRSPDALTLAAFALAVTIGAGNFIGVSFSNRELAPFWGAGLRFGIAATIFVAIVLVRRLPWPRGTTLRLTMAYGVLSFAVSYALMYWALVRVSAGVATVVMAVVPLATLLLAAAQGLERVRLRGGVGALLACAGILWMAVGPQDVVLPVAALIAMLAASAAIAQAVIVSKRIAQNHPAVTNAVGMLVGAVLLLAFSAIAGEAWGLPQETAVIVAVAYLVTIGSVGLFVLALLVVRRWTASATSYMFVLFPVVTMLLDTVFTQTPITVSALIGALLVMAGVWFGALSPGARRAAAADHPQVPRTEAETEAISAG